MKNKVNKMKALIKQCRIDKKLKIRELAQMIGIDQALISKFENGKRIPTANQIKQLSATLEIPYKELKIKWLKEKILSEYQNEDYIKEALIVAEESLEYNTKEERKNCSDIISDEDIESITKLKATLNEKRRTQHVKILEALELEYTYESNKIEGNTLTLQETDLVLNKGITISGKSLNEHLEVINHSEAIVYIKDILKKKISITEKVILDLHYLILKGINSKYAGKYRAVQVMISGSKHIPPPPYLVAKQMEDLMIWYNMNKNTLHPIILAAEMHQRLVTIHPFIDGNGRSSRLIMNLILLQNGFVIANIKGDDDNKMKYYKTLEKSRIDSTKMDFINFIFEVEKESLERIISIIG